MKGGLYSKLAVSNIRKNKQMVLPYLICSAGMVAVFYIIFALYQNTGEGAFRGASATNEILGFGIYVIGFFAAIVMFYSNNFMLKQRKHEFGVYNMLGMEKRHIIRIVTLENIYESLLSLGMGLVTGLVFHKAAFLLLMWMVQDSKGVVFQMSLPAMEYTLILFVIIFLVNEINGVRQIACSNTIELIRGSDVGEREPKSKWILAILGVASLAAAYYLAVSVADPVQALSFFFVAVLLVIVGTYLIFIAGSIVFLKMLRKNKKYYYRTNHFISVSGMLYRMKQNAASLASICILSTMVLVTVSGTMTLYTGAQECIDRMYPREVNLYVSLNVTEEERENLKEIKADYMEFMQSSIEEQQLIPADETALAYFTVAATWTGAGFEYMEVNNVTSGNSLGDNYEVVVMDAENYEGLTGEAVELEPNQVLVWKMNEAFDYDSFTYAGHLFQVAEVKKELANDAIVWDGNSNMICIVVDSEETYIQLYQEQADKYGEQASGEIFYYGVNVDEEKSSQLKSDFLEKYSDYWDSHDRDSQASINTWLLVKVRSTAASDLMSSYSGIFFVGIFLGLVFLATTIVIMYYKQLSEGYQDRRRFQIMEKVGLTKREVKKSIRSQVLTVFFMPLLMAGLHTAFAFPMLSKGLRLFNMTNTKLFALCTLSCFGVFALVYVVIYTITSRTYYRIVSQS